LSWDSNLASVRASFRKRSRPNWKSSEVLLCGLRAGGDLLLVAAVDGGVLREVLLHRHGHLQHLVKREVRDAEAAHAQDASDPELVAQQRTRRKSKRTALVLLEDRIPLPITMQS
jgi:hypothetical protein